MQVGSRAYALLRLARWSVQGPERRREAWVMARRPANLFQPYAATRLDRYPEAVEAVRRELGTAAPRLLSFGCSSGEEPAGLAQAWPEATVRGLDVNGAAVRAARRLVRRADLADRVSIGRAGDASSEPPASYDAVFAMAVFRHGDLGSAPETCRPLLCFQDVEATLGTLVDALRPGGLLVLRHANVRLADTAAAACCTRVAGPWPADGPVYDRDDRLVLGAVGDDGVFRKQAR